MVGMAKSIAIVILELDKREDLLSLLECRDQMVRHDKQAGKLQGHSILY
jgi:hypothetical protein